MTDDPMPAGPRVTGPVARSMPVSGATSLPVFGAAALIGSYRWIERRLFEIVGAWTASEPIAEACLFYDAQSQQHAWHAELWADRLPVLDGFDPDAVTVAPSDEVAGVLDHLAGGDRAGDSGAGGTLLRLVGLGRVVLPRLITGYRRHLDRTTPVADAPVVRALGLVLHDELAAWQQAEALVQRLVRRPHDVAVVTAHQQELESLVAGTPGFTPWPDPTWPGTGTGSQPSGPVVVSPQAVPAAPPPPVRHPSPSSGTAPEEGPPGPSVGPAGPAPGAPAPAPSVPAATDPTPPAGVPPVIGT